MITLHVGNVVTAVEGFLDPVVYKALRNHLGYRPENALWMQKNLSFEWSGIVSTVCYKGKCKCPIIKDKIHFPSGLLAKAWEVLDQYKVVYQIKDQRSEVCTTDRYKLSDVKTPYPYQAEIIHTSVERGRGILKLATGGGKTLVAASIIASLGVTPFVFYVPSCDLLQQAYDEFRTMIRTKDGQMVPIGRVGGGHRDIQDITVMTVQSAIRSLDEEKYRLSKEAHERIALRRKEWEELQARKAERCRVREAKEAEKARMRAERAAQGLKPLKKYETTIYKDSLPEPGEASLAVDQEKDEDEAIDGTEEFEDFGEFRKEVKTLVHTSKGIICDETHHWASETCRWIADHSLACRYRYGFSATPWRDMGDDLLIDACFGKSIADINASYLIDRNFLVPPSIFLVPVNNMRRVKFADYVEAYELGIVHNEQRNRWIGNMASNLAKSGRQVLILVKHIAHGDLLEEMIPGSVFLYSKKTPTQRKAHLDLMRERKASITIASTIFDEGIDVRPLDGLILAGGGKSSTRALQRVGRVIRPFSFGDYIKKDAVVVDFNDDMKWMRDHFKERLKIYRTEPRFVLKELVLGANDNA